MRKLTESQLRRIVRSIIKEQYSKKMGHGPDAFEKSYDDVNDPWSAEGDLEYVDSPFNDDWRKLKQGNYDPEDMGGASSMHDEELKSQRGAFGSRTRRSAVTGKASTVQKHEPEYVSAKSVIRGRKTSPQKKSVPEREWSHKISLIDND